MAPGGVDEALADQLAEMQQQLMRLWSDNATIWLIAAWSNCPSPNIFQERMCAVQSWVQAWVTGWQPDSNFNGGGGGMDLVSQAFQIKRLPTILASSLKWSYYPCRVSPNTQHALP